MRDDDEMNRREWFLSLACIWPLSLLGEKSTPVPAVKFREKTVFLPSRLELGTVPFVVRDGCSAEAAGNYINDVVRGIVESNVQGR